MATKLFLRDAASDINPGAELEKALTLTAGSAKVTKLTDTVASGTNIQVTDGSGGTAITWLSNGLAAVTIAGTVTFETYGSESNMSANAGHGVKVERTNNAGTVQSTIIDSSHGAEFAVHASTVYVRSWTGTPTSTALSAGDRIKITVYIRNVGTMGGPYTALTGYGAADATEGGAWVQFFETITESSGTTQTITPTGTLTTAGALALKVTRPIAGTMASAGAIVRKATQTGLAGTMASAGALAKKVSVPQAGTLTSAGALTQSKVTSLAVAGTMASAGALSLKVTKAVAGTLTSAGALSPQNVAQRNLAGTLAPTGALTHKASVSQAGTLATAGSLANSLLQSLAASGTLTTTGALVHKVSRALAGTLPTAGGLAHTAKVSQSGTLTTSGTLANSLLQTVAAGGTLTTAGTLSLKVSHALTGTVATAGAVTQAVSVSHAGTLTTAGALANVEIPGGGTTETLAAAGTLTMAGSLALVEIPGVAPTVGGAPAQGRRWTPFPQPEAPKPPVVVVVDSSPARITAAGVVAVRAGSVSVRSAPALVEGHAPQWAAMAGQVTTDSAWMIEEATGYVHAAGVILTEGSTLVSVDEAEEERILELV